MAEAQKEEGLMKTAYAVLPILLLALVAAPVCCWTPVTTSGDWALIERDHFIKEGDNSGYAEWTENVADFGGYWLMLHNVTWENYREWWYFWTYNDVYIKLEFETSGGTVMAVTKLHGATDFFGGLNTFHVSVGASTEATSWDQVPLIVPSFAYYGLDVTGWNPEEFQLFVKPEANQTKLVWMWTVGDRNVAHTVVCPVVLDGPATVTLIYEHSGYGYAEGYVGDSFTVPAMPPYEDFRSGWMEWLSHAIGIDLGAAISTLLIIVRLFFEAVRLTVPLLGAIVFLWMIDTIFTAITTGEVRLIGDMFLRIYEVVMSIWRTLVNIIEAIWDVITFWS